MESLVKLDVSHNELTTLLDFQPPKNLIVSQHMIAFTARTGLPGPA